MSAACLAQAKSDSRGIDREVDCGIDGLDSLVHQDTSQLYSLGQSQLPLPLPVPRGPPMAGPRSPRAICPPANMILESAFVRSARGDLGSVLSVERQA